jgi:2-(1,2-epoxy-1,2-dihydrophenyl)acetyl-CoA isomerase
MTSLLVDITDGVATLTLNRPESLNSLDTSLKVKLRETLAKIADDDSVRAVVLTGAGRAFCVGQDLREHVDMLDQGDPAPLSTVDIHYNPIATSIAGMGKPVIAAIRGMAAGAGAGLALLADFRVGGPTTGLLMAFANVGLAGDTAVSWTLPRLVGHAKAIELLMLAQPVDAATAMRLGLLTQLVDDDDAVLPAALALATRLAAGPTIAYGLIKQQLIIGTSGTLEESLGTESRTQAIAGATADHRDSVAAFVAKRKPVFNGH